MRQVTLEIHDMKCDGCVGTVREVLQDVDGVLGAEVSLEDESARIQIEDDVAAGELVAAVEEAGYGASPA